MKRRKKYIRTFLLFCLLTITAFNYAQPCSVVANILYNQGANGLVNFTNTSTGTVVGTTYLWIYGDGANSTATASPHTYTANGTYTLFLVANNNFSTTCLDSLTAAITVTNVISPCSLIAGYIKSQGPNGLVNFTNTSTGTVVGTTYLWIYGDGTSSTGIAPPHTYSANGNYNCYLLANNNFSLTCLDSVNSIINVNSYCALNAAFNHTVGIGGTVNFSNTSTGTYSGTLVSWNFGDGFVGSGNVPSHNYASAGAYIVSLVISNGVGCSDTIQQSVNVTGIICVANSGFSIASTPTPQYWTAAPNYPYNVIAASWNWGDGSTSNTLFASHTYSAAAIYNICLSVTVSCAGSSSTCVSQFISRSATENMAIININVIAPTTTVVGIKNVEIETIEYAIFPNPNNGEFNLKISGANSQKINVGIYNLMGEKVYDRMGEITNGEYNAEINLIEKPAGIYFMKVNCGDKFATQKLILNK